MTGVVAVAIFAVVAAYGAGRRWSPGEWVAWLSGWAFCVLAALVVTGGL